MNCIDFLKDIVTELTGKTPVVDILEDEHGAVITLKVSGSISSLIGKHGVTIDAIRTVTKAIGHNGLHRIKLRLNED